MSLSLFFFYLTGRVVDLGLSAVYVDPFIYLRKDFNSSPLGSLCTPVKRHTIGSLMTLCYCGAWIFHQQQYSLPQWDWPEICNQPWAASLVPKTAGWMRFSLKPLSALSLSTFPIASVAHIYNLFTHSSVVWLCSKNGCWGQSREQKGQSSFSHGAYVLICGEWQ